MTVNDKAIDLGRAVTETDAYKNLQKVQAAMIEDGEAQKLIQDFQKLRNSYDRMQSMGHELEEKHLEKLKELHDRMMENQLVKQYEEARSEFDQLLADVNAKINEGMGKNQGGNSCDSGSCGSGGCSC